MTLAGDSPGNLHARRGHLTALPNYVGLESQRSEISCAVDPSVAQGRGVARVCRAVRNNHEPYGLE